MVSNSVKVRFWWATALTALALVALFMVGVLPISNAATPPLLMPSDSLSGAGDAGVAQPGSAAALALARTPSVRTPVPNSLYPYPEQRVGFVAFNMGAYDVQMLNAGFAKLEDRGPRTSEKALGLDFITVLRVGPQFYKAPDPTTYWSELAAKVAASPGYLWFIGNEPENPCRGERSSREYAEIYHDMYTFIKAQDPSAQVGIGGVVLPSQIRRDWLDRVLSEYLGRYGEAMPVDVWNVHVLLLSECPGPCGCTEPNPYPALCCSGAYVPKEMWPRKGLYYDPMNDQDRGDEVIRLLREFRTWMKDRGAQNKPLVVTEMGVFAGVQNDMFSHDRINRFMYTTYNFMMTATDPAIGYPADGNRLVQRWAWYSLSHRSFNGYLFDGDSNLTDFGRNFANYNARFLPWSPTEIFFQRGWSGYEDNGDITLKSGARDPNNSSLYVSGDQKEKALVKFDLTLLPTDVEVVSATLSLYAWHVDRIGSLTLRAYEVLRPWTISAVSWVSATQSTSWQTAGCSGDADRNPSPVGTAQVTTPKAFYSLDVTHLAQKWVADPTTNHGVVLTGQASGAGYWVFVSSDQPETVPYALNRYRPKLELTVRVVQTTPSPTVTASRTATATATAAASRTPTQTSVVTHTPSTATNTATLGLWRVVLPVIRKLS